MIGAGLSGLWLAKKLSDVGVQVTLLEASPRAGGRIRTAYREDETDHHADQRSPRRLHVEYEAGPWRVPRNHRRVRALFKEAGFHLRPLKTDPPRHQDPPSSSYDQTSEECSGQSIWGCTALTTGNPLVADERDLATGYADETRAAHGTTPYVTDAEGYDVADEGFSALVTFLVGALRARRNVKVVTNARVADVTRLRRGTYDVRCRKRTGHSSFSSFSLIVKSVFCCVPPSSCREWDVMQKWAKSQMCAVRSGCLNHVYVRPTSSAALDLDRRPRFHKIATDNVLGQTVSSQYDESDYFQASYAAGRVARMWYHLRLTDAASYVRRLLLDVKASVGVDVDADDVRSHFWEEAYHHWVPVPHFDLQSSVLRSVRPHPSCLPMVYVAGEAFSSHQAWMEGALETAELAFDAFQEDRSRSYVTASPSTADVMTLQGHVLDVKRWSGVHPGSANAILGHLGEDVEALFRHMGHSSYAWAVAYSLRT